MSVQFKIVPITMANIKGVENLRSFQSNFAFITLPKWTPVNLRKNFTITKNPTTVDITVGMMIANSFENRKYVAINDKTKMVGFSMLETKILYFNNRNP